MTDPKAPTQPAVTVEDCAARAIAKELGPRPWDEMPKDQDELKMWIGENYEGAFYPNEPTQEACLAVANYILSLARLSAAPQPLPADPGVVELREALERIRDYQVNRDPDYTSSQWVMVYSQVAGGMRAIATAALQASPPPMRDVEVLRALSDKATAGVWKHYDEVFRRQFGKGRITEIQRADGKAIVNWGGFDGLPGATAKKRNHNAAFIVACVNYVREALHPASPGKGDA